MIAHDRESCPDCHGRKGKLNLEGFEGWDNPERFKQEIRKLVHCLDELQRFRGAKENLALLEKHYQVKELVALLGWSRTRIRKRFKFHARTVRDGKRYFVPQSVVEEVVGQLQSNARIMPVRRGRPRSRAK